jgi:hypothetical protein
MRRLSLCTKEVLVCEIAAKNLRTGGWWHCCGARRPGGNLATAFIGNSANHSHGQLYDSFCIFDGLDAIALHAPANGKRPSGVIAAGFLKVSKQLCE